MANNRVRDEVDAVAVNGINLGGISSVGSNQEYVDNVESDDGGQGPAQLDQSGEKVTVSVGSTDVRQLIPLLIADPATVVYYGRESGASTYVKSTVGTGNSPVVLVAGSLNLSRGSYATMSVDGTVRSDGSEQFDTICAYIDGQVAPTMFDPSRLWKPTAITHGAQAVLHPVDVSVRIAAEVREGYGDGDKGISFVDIVRWAISVDANVCDSAELGVSSYEVTTELLKQGTKNLVIDLEGVGQQAAQVLTLRNCQFRTRRKTSGRNITGHALSGVLQWADPLTPFTKRTLDDATPANRMVNFVDA